MKQVKGVKEDGWNPNVGFPFSEYNAKQHPAYRIRFDNLGGGKKQ